MSITAQTMEKVRDEWEAPLRARIADLETALRSVVDAHRDRYACASEWNAIFETARTKLSEGLPTSDKQGHISRP